MMAAAIEVWGLGLGTKGGGMALRGEERATGATGRVAGEEGSGRDRENSRRAGLRKVVDAGGASL